MGGFGQFAATVLLMILLFGTLFLLAMALAHVGKKVTNRRQRGTQEHERYPLD
jgi:hypothetical protein